MSHPALTRLRALRYFAVMPSLPPPLSDWLLLEDSMTQRFEQQGKQVTVTLVNEGYIGRDALTEDVYKRQSSWSVPTARGCERQF